MDPPEKVARAVVRALDRPRRETSVGIANPVVVLGFRTLPAVYDRLVVPLMRVGGLSKAPVEVNDGNVFDPVPAGEATHGEWGRHWLRPVAGLAGVAGAGAAVAVARSRGGDAVRWARQWGTNRTGGGR